MSESGPGSVRGLDIPAVTRWLADHVEGADGELRFELVAAGGSNLTYRVESDSGMRWALRRPPERARVATAHDMAREWKIMSALAAHPEAGVPVPAAIAYCTDPAIVGAEFYVMEFAEGRILRGPADAESMNASRCRRAAESLIDVQVAMHTIDADAVGLGDLGRRDAYVERQLSRWLRQYEAVKSRELPLVHELHARLAKSVPPQQRVGLVHGDYRFDNTVLGPDDRVIAVLDWELCTLGDPVADFCLVDPLLERSGRAERFRLALSHSPSRLPAPCGSDRDIRPQIGPRSRAVRLLPRLQLVEDGLPRRGCRRTPACRSGRRTCGFVEHRRHHETCRVDARSSRRRGERDRARTLSGHAPESPLVTYIDETSPGRPQPLDASSTASAFRARGG